MIAGVAATGPAFAAGLRNGQSVVGYSIFNHNPDKVARITVHSDGEDRKMTYLPRGKALLGWRYEMTGARSCEAGISKGH